MSYPTEPEMQPDDAEVLQVEDPGYAHSVPVTVAGPVRTQEMPRKAGATRNRALANGSAAVALLSADPRRASAVVCADAAFWFAFSQNGASGAAASPQDFTGMCKWPANVPLRVNTSTDLYVAAAGAAVNVSYYTELWAAGA